MNDLCVLNEPTEEYTFSDPRDESDIDVTAVNDVWLKFDSTWEIRDEWGLSDYNVILISVRTKVKRDENSVQVDKKWCKRKADWDGYVNRMRELAGETGEYRDMVLKEKLLRVYK